MTATAEQVKHYQREAVLAAAVAWHEATTPAEVDAACESLHRTVAAFLAPPVTLMDVAFPQRGAAAAGLMGLGVRG